MISEAEFIRQVTEAGHASSLRRMTLPELSYFCRDTQHELCIWYPDKESLKHSVSQIVEMPGFNDTNMFVRKFSKRDGFARHPSGVAWLDGCQWAGYDYYVIPIESTPLDIADLIQGVNPVWVKRLK